KKGRLIARALLSGGKLSDCQMLNRLSPASIFNAREVPVGFDLREVLSFAWRQWKFIAAVVAISLLVGTISLLRQTFLYTATAQVWLEPQRAKLPGSEIIADVSLDLAMIESQTAIIRSSEFLRRVVEKERLVSDAEFGSGVAQGASLVANAGPAK